MASLFYVVPMDFKLDIPNVSYIFLQLHIHKDIIRIQVLITPYIDDWIFFFFNLQNCIGFAIHQHESNTGVLNWSLCHYSPLPSMHSTR